MEKVIISILGQDGPGILATVSRLLSLRDCNIENVGQTILQSEFAGLFIVSIPETLSAAELMNLLRTELQPRHPNVHVKPLEEAKQARPSADAVPFIVTTIGPDRKGLVAGISGVIARYGANITNLKAVFKGGDNPNRNFMIYEIDVPSTVNQQVFNQSLRNMASELGLEITIQHQNIFDAVNKI